MFLLTFTIGSKTIENLSGVLFTIKSLISLSRLIHLLLVYMHIRYAPTHWRIINKNNFSYHSVSFFLVLFRTSSSVTSHKISRDLANFLQYLSWSFFNYCIAGSFKFLSLIRITASFTIVSICYIPRPPWFLSVYTMLCRLWYLDVV